MSALSNTADMLQDNRGRAREIVEEAQRLALKLDADPTIHPQFHTDIFILMKGAVALSSALIEPTYPVETVIAESARILHSLASVIEHAAVSRQVSKAWGIYDLTSNTTWNSLFGSEDAAKAEVARLKALGVTLNLEPILVAISPLNVVRPSLPEPGT